MATRTRRLGAVSPAANVVTNLYTCPAGVVGLLKFLHLTSTDTTAAAYYCWMLVNNVGDGHFIVSEASFPGNAIRLLEVWMPMMPGDTLKVLHTGGKGTAAAYGAELPGL